jgi:hypothetical protein
MQKYTFLSRDRCSPGPFHNILYLKFESGNNKKLNSVVLVRKRTIPTEQPQPAGEVSANLS